MISGRKGTLISKYMDLIVSFFLLILLVIFFFNNFMDSRETIEHTITEKSAEVSAKENFLVFMRSPAGEASGGGSFRGMNFSDGEMALRLDFGKSREHLFYMNADAGGYASASMDADPGHGSNILAIDGGADDITEMLEERGIYAQPGSWNDLGPYHSVIFAGCSSPFPTNPGTIRSWVYAGGTLISTDFMIDGLALIFGDELPIYTDFESFPDREQGIRFTGDAVSEFGQLSPGSLEGTYRRTLIKQGREEEVKVIAEFTDLDSSAWGFPIYEFRYGSGRVIHITAHLDDSITTVDGDFIDGIFDATGEGAINPSLDFGSDGSIDWAYEGRLDKGSAVSFSGQLNAYISTECSTNHCRFPIQAKGDAGVLLLNGLKVSEEWQLFVQGLHAKTVTDMIADSYYSGDFGIVRQLMADFTEKMRTPSSRYTITVSEISTQEEILDVGYDPCPVDTRVVTSAYVPLVEPGKGLLVKLIESRGACTW